MDKKITRTGLRLLALALVVVVLGPVAAGCATAPAAEAATVFDVQGGATTDDVGMLVSAALALFWVALFWYQLGTAFNAIE